MKKSIFYLFAASSLLANDTTLLDIAQFQICSYKSNKALNCIENPFGLLANTNVIANAPLVENHSQHIQYSDGQVEALYGFRLAPGSGATLNLGTGFTNLVWDENPYFSTHDFPFLNAGISFYSDGIPNWFWQAGINAQVQTQTSGENVASEYTRYSSLLWGRYSYSAPLGIHFGLLLFTGIHKTVAYPILGVDWTISPAWQLYLIFPINLSLFYNFNESWSLSLAGRPFSARHRVKNNQPVPEGIVEYHNYGTELSLNYTSCDILFALYGGYSYGGTMKFEEANGGTLGYRHFQTAPYVGLNFLWSF